MPRSPTQDRAEKVAETIRAFSALADALSWQLDDALSSIEKDKAGYRTSNAANRTGGANYVEGELETAVYAAEEFLARCGEPVAVKDAASLALLAA
jgi:hypothetical protein